MPNVIEDYVIADDEEMVKHLLKKGYVLYGYPMPSKDGFIQAMIKPPSAEDILESMEQTLKQWRGD